MLTLSEPGTATRLIRLPLSFRELCSICVVVVNVFAVRLRDFKGFQDFHLIPRGSPLGAEAFMRAIISTQHRDQQRSVSVDISLESILLDERIRFCASNSLRFKRDPLAAAD